MATLLRVWWDGREVGSLVLDAQDRMSFTYCASWLADSSSRPVSASLPLRPNVYVHEEVFPFFEGFLPEGVHRGIIARNLRIPEGNVFHFLEKLGGEIAGALQIQLDCPDVVKFPQTIELPALSDNEIEELILQMPVNPMLAVSQDELRISLAGAQSKLPVIKVADGIALPVNGLPTTHILKPEISAFEGTSENEVLCMRLASAIGLETASIQYATARHARYVLIERYDRIRNQSGQIQRLHQEDFCQALGLASHRKYAEHGGPELWNCMDVLRCNAAQPAGEMAKLLDAAIFNAIIGNADAHAKNFSLLYKPSGTVLAPLYDLMSTAVYPKLSPRFAMRIGNCWTLNEITPVGWSKFAEDIGIANRQVIKRVREIAEVVQSMVSEALGEIQLPKERLMFGEKVAKVIETRAETALLSSRER